MFSFVYHPSINGGSFFCLRYVYVCSCGLWIGMVLFHLSLDICLYIFLCLILVKMLFISCLCLWTIWFHFVWFSDLSKWTVYSLILLRCPNIIVISYFHHQRFVTSTSRNRTFMFFVVSTCVCVAMALTGHRILLTHL